MSYAIISLGGKQYRVSEGQRLLVDKLPTEDGKTFTAEAIFGLYRQETDLANDIIAARAPDAEPAWWPAEIFPGLAPRPLRDTVLHVLTETACHAGHLDAVRELIDGRTWLVLTD